MSRYTRDPECVGYIDSRRLSRSSALETRGRYVKDSVRGVWLFVFKVCVSARTHAGVLYTLTPLLSTALGSQPPIYSHGYQILMSVCPVGISLWSKAPTKGERKCVTKANGPLVNYGRG